MESWHDEHLKWICGFASANLPNPVFESHCGGVRVTVMRPDAASGGKRDAAGTGLKTGLNEGDSAAQTMAKLIADNPTITIPMLSTETGLS